MKLRLITARGKFAALKREIDGDLKADWFSSESAVSKASEILKTCSVHSGEGSSETDQVAEESEEEMIEEERAKAIGTCIMTVSLSSLLEISEPLAWFPKHCGGDAVGIAFPYSASRRHVCRKFRIREVWKTHSQPTL